MFQAISFVSRMSSMLVTVFIGVWSIPAHADIAVPAGASYQLAGGTTNLACTDFQISGAVTQGSGGATIGARNVQISAGGQMDISGGSLQLAQNYTNQGTVLSTGGAITRVNSANCPAQGLLGTVAPGGQAPLRDAKPVPTLTSIELLALSLMIACMAGLRFRRSA